MYSTKTGLVLGFHGCDKSIINDILLGKKELKQSDNTYDWLGHGIYFWENSPSRAVEFAEFLKNNPQRARTPIKSPSVIGENKDLLFRELDCAVIETLHSLRSSDSDLKPFDSVRGVFWEGKEIYPNAGFKEKNHIQICIRNRYCIKGYFLPRKFDSDYSKV